MIEDSDITHWRIDKRIPLALVVVLITQIAVGVAAFTQVQSDVRYVRENVIDLKERLDIIDQRSAQVDGIKVEIRFLNKNLERMRTVLDKLADKVE